ncbi:MAG: peptide-methionine (S)-S-oxide reductase MsrA [Cyanobacteria bacterium J06554_3]
MTWNITGLTRQPKQAFARQILTGALLFILSWSTLGCAPANSAESSAAAANPNSTELATATFAGGCFWCMEQPFDALPGVSETTSGYTGGTVENPTYYQVSDGDTGHVEAMQVSYDPTQVSYDELLDTFWHNIDPTDNLGQFCDKGSQYRSAIFYTDDSQQALAEASKDAIAGQLNQTIATDILPATTFYPAEDYHQNYYQTRPVRYKVYRFGCGRDQRLADIWGADAPSHD